MTPASVVAWPGGRAASSASTSARIERMGGQCTSGPRALAAAPAVRWPTSWAARVEVSQRDGTVAWQVGSDDTLVIDAGATVATVEATGASLRVEVKMLDRTDVRLTTGSATVAAAAALVTVLVYEGSAKVSHDAHSVNVVAGARYDTSGRSGVFGSRWQPELRDNKGFTVVHPPGL